MKRKVIYKKTYPKTDHEEQEALSEGNCRLDEMELSAPSFEEFMKWMYKDTVYWLIPERVKTANEFMNRAIKLSEIYHIDTEIVRHDAHITVNYFFDSCACMGFLKELILYADDIAFFTNIEGHEILLSMDYYTHAIFRNGHKVQPKD